jgi:alpha-tubulin suppressor-like RCC1 family protein
MPYINTGKQYSGSWTMQQHLQAVAASTWTGLSGSGWLYAWGQGTNGQLGQGDVINRSSPVQVGTLNTWKSAAGSGYTSFAIKTDGTLWAWGNNDYGKLGINLVPVSGAPGDKSSPVQVGSLSNWLSMATGYSNALAIKTDGTLWTWGYGLFGRLGLGDTTDRSSPTQVGALTNWSKASVGFRHTAAIKADGTLWVWGNNTYGQLGQNNVTYRSSPVQIGSLTTWSFVFAGDFNSAAIKTDGTLWTWGYNQYGALGQNTGSTISRSSPVQVGSGTTWASVAFGGQGGVAFTLATKTDGTLWTWGANNNGQLGQNDTTNRSSPVQVGSLTTWLKVAGSYNGAAAIKTDGTLWTWGKNEVGYLGQNNVIYRSSPVQVGSLTNWESISNGVNFFIAIAKTLS